MITKIKSHEDFIKISKTYKNSLKKVNSKINETTDKSELTVLKSMAKDLKDSIKELENYYKTSYWRNEKITMNSRKAIKVHFNNLEEMD